MQNKRDLPWRNTCDPYIIWLSEIILQQTRVSQGLPYFDAFVAEFPTVFDLAKASEEKVLRLWQGLGYYSRARNLHACALQIVKDFDGKFPDNYEDLLKLKGVGQYTAAAIASFAYKEAVPVVDGNVYRVLARLFNLDTDIGSGKGQKAFFSLANEVMDKSAPDIYNQAIMEFGALHCTPKSPDCHQCIFADVCQAHLLNLQSSLPVKLKKVKVKTRYFHYLVIEQSNKIGMKVRGAKDIWQGLYDFYLIENEHELEEEDIVKYTKESLSNEAEFTLLKVSATYKHVLTHQRIFAKFFHLKYHEAKNDDNEPLNKEISFFRLEEINHLPKPILVANYLNEHIF